MRSLNQRAGAFAAEFDLAGGAGSDCARARRAQQAAYVEMPDFDGPHDFLAKLREARVVGHHWDKARPSKARILPGTTTD